MKTFSDSIVYYFDVVGLTSSAIILKNSSIGAYLIGTDLYIAFNSDNTFQSILISSGIISDIEFYFSTDWTSMTCNYTYDELILLRNLGYVFPRATVFEADGYKCDDVYCAWYGNDRYPDLEFRYSYLTKGEYGQPYYTDVSVYYGPEGCSFQNMEPAAAYYRYPIWFNGNVDRIDELYIEHENIADYDFIEIVSTISYPEFEDGDYSRVILGPRAVFHNYAIQGGYTSIVECNLTDGWDIDEYWQRSIWIDNNYYDSDDNKYYTGIYIDSAYYCHPSRDPEWGYTNTVLIPLAIYGWKYD